VRLLPLLLLAAACAATGTVMADDEAELAHELAGRSAGEPKDCVPTSTGANLAARGRRTLVYDQGATFWVNRLAADCPGLDSTSQIVIEVDGSRYCRGDRLRARHGGESVPGPICVLGDFTPYRR
jgi:hypothetical protein